LIFEVFEAWETYHSYHGRREARRGSFMEEERQEEEERIASMTLLSAIQKIGEQSSGRMYVKTKVRGK